MPEITTTRPAPYVKELVSALQVSGRDVDFYLKLLADSDWAEKPYGRKLDLMDLILIQVDPGLSTALGVKPEELDEHGLRGHPGAKYEKITVLGFADETGDRRPVLHYRFRARYSDVIQEQDFGQGATFYSVQMDKAQTGESHENVNPAGSPSPLVLLIEAQNKSYNEEVDDLNVRYEDLEAEVYRNWLNIVAVSILSEEARAQIQKLDDEYVQELVKMDKEQAVRRLERGVSPMRVIKIFEDRIGVASTAHAEAVLSLIGVIARPAAVGALRESYRTCCMDVFNPEDGMLKRYYAELEEINRRHVAPGAS